MIMRNKVKAVYLKLDNSMLVLKGCKVPRWKIRYCSEESMERQVGNRLALRMEQGGSESSTAIT